MKRATYVNIATYAGAAEHNILGGGGTLREVGIYNRRDQSVF